MSELYENVFTDESKTSLLSEEEQKYRSGFSKRLLFSLAYIALTVAFSFFSLVDKDIENTFMPMHIPVLLGSFVCGGPLGFVIGFVSPLLKHFLFDGTLSLLEVLCCSFELAVCGCIGGYLFRSMPTKFPYISLNVAISLIVSKLSFYLLKYLLTIFFLGTNLSIETFISQRFYLALIGVAFQIVAIPFVVMIFRKSKIAFT